MREKDIIKFVNEFDRMCDSFDQINIDEIDRDCDSSCPLFAERKKYREENDFNILSCWDLFADKPEVVVPIVLEWSRKNPKKTRLLDFMEKHPNAPLNKAGYPKACAKKCGYVQENHVCRVNCASCWDTDVEEEI